jgi:transcriptional regulator with XRE-family HTH domain
MAKGSNSFCRYLKRWRKQLGLTQREMAARLGVCVNHYGFVERGDSEPFGDSILARLARVVQVDELELYWLADRIPAPARELVRKELRERSAGKGMS